MKNALAQWVTPEGGCTCSQASEVLGRVCGFVHAARHFADSIAESSPAQASTTTAAQEVALAQLIMS